MKPHYYPLVGSIAFLAAAFLMTGCDGKKASTAKNDRETNASATYVAPGEKDEYYLFYSGGHSGQIYVSGIPSMRHISTIPVFAPYPGTGYGFDEASKKMIGDYTWGDVHHPALSQDILRDVNIVMRFEISLCEQVVCELGWFSVVDSNVCTILPISSGY